MFYTDDPALDFNRWDAEQQRELEMLPTCINCGEPIQDDYCYEIDDELYCEECMKDTFRRRTEDFVEGW